MKAFGRVIISPSFDALNGSRSTIVPQSSLALAVYAFENLPVMNASLRCDRHAREAPLPMRQGSRMVQFPVQPHLQECESPRGTCPILHDAWWLLRPSRPESGPIHRSLLPLYDARGRYFSPVGHVTNARPYAHVLSFTVSRRGVRLVETHEAHRGDGSRRRTCGTRQGSSAVNSSARSTRAPT